MKILFIDDDPIRMGPHKRRLESAGYNVTMATTPSEAMKELERKEKIDLIILDILMPYEDKEPFTKNKTDSGLKTGVVLFSEIKKIRPDIPIVVLTIRKDEEIRDEFRERDIERFLTKPIMPDELLGEVEIVLGGRDG